MKTTFQHRIENPNGLSLNELQRRVPSMFTDTRAAGRSPRFTVIPTIDVVQALNDADFVLVMAMQANTRSGGDAEHAKHLLKFRARADLGNRAEVFEIVIINAANGDAAYTLDLGLFRSICENTLIFGDFDSYHVQHRGNIVDRVVEGTLELAKEQVEQREKVEQWKHIILPQSERLLLAEHVHRQRFGEDSNTLVTPQDLLNPRRSEDREIENTLAGTTHIVQENAIQGGQRRYNRKQGKRVRTRGVTNITGSVALNKAITAFAEELRKLHS